MPDVATPFPIQAQNDFVIGQTIDENGSTDFEVIDNQPKQQHIIVRSVGEDVRSCKVGDKIIPLGQEFQGFQIEGVTYIVMHDEQVLGVFLNV